MTTSARTSAATPFGRDAVFMDVAGVKKGLDFRRIIDEQVASCGVLLVIIGKRWLGATHSKGQRRLDEANDFVRLETAAALSRDIPVVPVLVHDAVMPKVQELPDALKELAFRNGTELTHARWDSDVKLLIEDLKPHLDKSPTGTLAPQPTREQSSVTTAPCTLPSDHPRTTRRSLWAAGGLMVVAGAISLVGYPLWQDRPPAKDITLAAVQTPPAADAQRKPDAPGTTQVVAPQPVLKAAVEAEKLDPTADQAEAAKAVAARAGAARAAAARKAADQIRKREEVERAVLLGEEQRKRDEADRRIAQEQAEKNRIAAEQAAAARMFTDIATAVLGSRQSNRR